MITSIKDKKELLDLASDFTGFIKKRGWISRYDSDSDSLSVTAPNLSKDARIRYFGNEIAFYITEDNRVEGLFLEYFKSNFVEHHRGLRPVIRAIEKEVSDGALIRINREEVQKIAPDLQKAIRSSLVETMSLNSQNKFSV